MALAGMSDPRHQEPERERLPREQTDASPVRTVRRVGHASATSVPWSAACNRRARVWITARAISGRSSSSSSKGPRRSRSSSDGSTAVADAARGAGARTASSPTTAPGPSTREGAIADVHTGRPGGDHVEPVLQRTARDERGAGLDVHLLEQPGDGDQRVPGTSANSGARCSTLTRSSVISSLVVLPPPDTR